jgi:hypothetical protein
VFAGGGVRAALVFCGVADFIVGGFAGDDFGVELTSGATGAIGILRQLKSSS